MNRTFEWVNANGDTVQITVRPRTVRDEIDHGQVGALMVAAGADSRHAFTFVSFVQSITDKNGALTVDGDLGFPVPKLSAPVDELLEAMEAFLDAPRLYEPWFLARLEAEKRGN